MWQANVLDHMVRLSDFGTTFASFSVAGILKRGLKQHGIQISRPRGFGHKREMLKAIWLDTSQTETQSQDSETTIAAPPKSETSKQRKIAIIGAGIAGLSSAWAFAQRGHQVTIYEQNEPLSGASGNPLALLNPKLCPIEQAHEHLMTLSWQHALNFYPQFKAFRPIQVQQIALKNADELSGLVEQYPENVLTANTTLECFPETEFPSLTLHQAGAVSPHQLRDEILQHANIRIEKVKISRLESTDSQVTLWQDQQIIAITDHAIVCCAKQSAELFENYPVLKPIRGQVSWVENSQRPLALDQAYSYGGYCMQLDTAQLILGASFYPNRDDAEVLTEDHVHNYALIHSVFPAYAQQLPSVDIWQGRASVRAQSLDYFPLLGKMQGDEHIYTFAGLGSKGFMFAPLCSEILAALILGELCPVPQKLLDKLNPQRFQKKAKVKKPYYSA